MELGILERAVILQALPKNPEDDYLTYKIITDLKKELSFSEEEIKKFKIEITGDKLTWDESKSKKKEIEIGDKGKEIIAEGFKSLNENKKINRFNVPLYEEFVLNKK